jgi:MFS transporter, FSR family, fosmidomycin resistance protein
VIQQTSLKTQLNLLLNFNAEIEPRLTPQRSNLPMVLVISFTHAMVHLAEQSFSSVEQVVCGEFRLSMEQSGYYGSLLRIPFGFGAFLTGMLADRVGASRVLTLYLTGTAVVCLSFLFTSSAQILALQLFVLGAFASMYHPAGLSMMTSITTPQDRAKALGIHGVFGSLGLGGAPLLAGVVLLIPNGTWRTFFMALGLLAAVLVFVFRWGNKRFSAHAFENAAAPVTGISPGDQERSRVFTPTQLQIRPFVILMFSSACSGIVYGGFLHFLKRYLSDVKSFDFLPINQDSIASVLAALVLFCGVAGQWVSGSIASPRRLAPMLSMIYLANVPLLLWIAMATGSMRLLPCCLLGFVHFMNQPVYNSLLPDYVPAKTRSTWFGFSQMMTFGIGALGPTLVGWCGDFQVAFAALAAISLLAGLLPIPIWLERHKQFAVD